MNVCRAWFQQPRTARNPLQIPTGTWPLNSGSARFSSRWRAAAGVGLVAASWAAIRLPCSPEVRCDDQLTEEQLKAELEAAACEQFPTLLAEAGWTAHIDPTSGKEYYHNAATQATTWAIPESVQKVCALFYANWICERVGTSLSCEEAEAMKQHVYELNLETMERLVAAGWTSHRDPDTGRGYLFNAGEQQTLAPGVSPPGMEAELKAWKESRFAEKKERWAAEKKAQCKEFVDFIKLCKSFVMWEEVWEEGWNFQDFEGPLVHDVTKEAIPLEAFQEYPAEVQAKVLAWAQGIKEKVADKSCKDAHRELAAEMEARAQNWFNMLYIAKLHGLLSEAGWEALEDPDDPDRVYYYHATTEASTTEIPTELKADLVAYVESCASLAVNVKEANGLGETCRAMRVRMQPETRVILSAWYQSSGGDEFPDDSDEVGRTSDSGSGEDDNSSDAT